MNLNRLFLLPVSFAITHFSLSSLAHSVTVTNLFFFNLLLSVIKKIVQYIGEVMEDSKDKVQENLLASGGRFCKALMFSKCSH